MTTTEEYEQILKSLGFNGKLPDKLQSTYLRAIADNIQNGESGIYTLVDYMETEKDAVKTRIKALTDTISNPIVIGFSTDQHCKVDASESWVQKKEDITQGMKALSNLTHEIAYDLVVGGGDNVNANGNTYEIKQVVDILNKSKCPTFNLTGNHDAYNGTGTDRELFYPHITKSVEDGRIRMHESNSWNNSGYMDSAKHKIRFVFIDNWYRNQGAVRNEFGTVLNKYLSEMPNGYKAIIFSHVGIDASLPTDADDRTVGWNNIIDASSVISTYAEKIICVINGHNHNDLSAYVNGIRHISTTCAGLYELNDGIERVNGTAKSTAFDTYVIDTENNTIHIVRFGVGSDRSCTIKESVVRDDAISNSVDENGDVYNEVGYKIGYRLNSSGAEVEIANTVARAEIALTGYIPCVQNDVIYFQDGMMPPTESAVNSISGISSTFTNCKDNMYIVLYNSSFAKLYAKSIANTYSGIGTSLIDDFIKDITYYDSGCIKSMTIERSDCAYIRFNAFNVQNGKLAKVNEEV